MAKKLACLCLGAVMLLSLAACKAQETTEEGADISVAESAEGEAFSFDAAVSVQEESAQSIEAE